MGGNALIRWLHRNRKWVFSGIGVAVLTTVLAFIVQWLSTPPTSEPTSSTTTIHQETHGSGSPAVANTQGNVTITTTSQPEEVKAP